MNDLHLELSQIWYELDQLPIPAPSHRNRTMTQWAAVIERVKKRLGKAGNISLALQDENVMLRHELDVRRHAHNVLVCGMWQRNAITEGEAAKFLGVDRIRARQMSEDIGLPWCEDPTGPLAPLFLEILETLQAGRAAPGLPEVHP